MDVKSYSFNPLTCKSVINLPTRDDYITSQYCSVSVRMHFEYKRCLDAGGLVYFVTFTYNDDGVFKFRGRNFLFNSHIRYLFNKSRFPRYIKSHGYSFKYASFGELGDGKGVRGFNNNPHYHCLIFLMPTSSCDNFYHSEYNFLSLCSDCWNSDVNSLSKSFKSLNRGSVSYSSSGACVSSEKCFAYCSSYCVKGLSDTSYSSRLRYLFKRVAFVTLFHLFRDLSYESSLRDLIYPYSDDFLLKFIRLHKSDFGIDFDGSDPAVFLSHCFGSSLSSFFSGLVGLPLLTLCQSSSFFISKLFDRIMDLPLFRYFFSYLMSIHSVRYFLSKGLGSNGLDYIDKDNFLMDVSFFHSFSAPRINLPSYYFRKFCFSSVKFGDIYVSVRNHNYHLYAVRNFTNEKYESALASFNNNKFAFARSLPLDLALSFSKIPSDVFVDFFPYQYLSFDSLSVPDLSSHWLSLANQSYAFDGVLSPYPVGLSETSKSRFFSYNLHPHFCNYPDISYLCSLYKIFVRRSVSSSILFSVNSYHNLKTAHESITFIP